MKLASLTVALCAAGLLAACSSAPMVAPSTGATSAPPVPTVSSPPTAPSTQTTMPAATAVPAYLDPNNPISTQRSVYFDFDDATVKKNYFALIERQGRYLASHPGLKVNVEGNTDERGSAEYNLALGQKRAEAVVHAMKVYGVSDSQMEATSWGGEKPKADGHDEAAWAQNRRADIVYPTR